MRLSGRRESPTERYSSSLYSLLVRPASHSTSPSVPRSIRNPHDSPRPSSLDSQSSRFSPSFLARFAILTILKIQEGNSTTPSPRPSSTPSNAATVSQGPSILSSPYDIISKKRITDFTLVARDFIVDRRKWRSTALRGSGRRMGGSRRHQGERERGTTCSIYFLVAFFYCRNLN